MKWETVKISSEIRGRTSPFASIGYGRVSLNAAACSLISSHEEFKYAEFLKCKNRKKDFIGIKLLKNSTQNSLSISRKKQDGKYVAGLTVENKDIVGSLFGDVGTAAKVTRFTVEKDHDYDDVLIISYN